VRRPPLFWTFAFVCAGLALLPTNALAQESPVVSTNETIDSPYRWRERGFRLGLFGGLHRGNRGRLDFGQGPTAAAGAKLRARVSNPLSLELGLAYGPARRWVLDLAAEGGPAIIDTVNATWLRLEAGGQIGLTGARTWHGIHPYGVFGAGWVIEVDGGASELLADPTLAPFRYDIGTAPFLNLGLGFEIFPTEKIGIGFEIRDYLIRQTAPAGFLVPNLLRTLEEAGAPAPEASAWLHNPEFGIMIWYYF